MAKAIRKKTAERRRYTAEYRREALLLADKVGVAEAAKQLGLHESQLYNWRGKDRLERSQSDAEKQQALEIVRLKRQLAEKTEDLTILKNDSSRARLFMWKKPVGCVYIASRRAAADTLLVVFPVKKPGPGIEANSTLATPLGDPV